MTRISLPEIPLRQPP